MSKRISWLLPVMLVLFWSGRADAAPIMTVAGETYTFNFDFTGVSPAPPYAFMSFVTNRAAGTFDAADAGTFSIFGGLNGTGVVIGNLDVGLNSSGSGAA